MCIGSKPPKDNSAEIARRQAEEREARIRQGQGAIDQAFAPFNDDYFDQYRESYLGYYQPQLERQMQDARRKLVLSLSRTGNLTSSSGGGKIGDLMRSYKDQTALLGNNALTAANDLRGRIEQSRSDLYAQNRAAADPSLVSSQAAASAGLLSAPPTFSPLGNVFADILNNATVGVAAEARGYPGFRTGLFNSGGQGSSRIVR